MYFFYILAYSIIGLGLLLVNHTAYAIQLTLPIDCTLNKDCFIQKYVDTDPGKTYRDYRCGHLTNHGHTGTDFRIKDIEVMQAKVPVIAAEDGVVIAIRKHMKDILVSKADPKSITNKECGNAVILRHENHYTTSYCHLKQHSVKVQKDQHVKRGQLLGYVGLSGSTEFPHVHFGVKHNGKVVDPFTNITDPQYCSQTTNLANSLWHPDIRASLTYNPTHLLNVYFSEEPLTFEQARDGRHRKTYIDPKADNFIVWTTLMGPLKGDILTLQLFSPMGTLMAGHQHVFKKPKADYYFMVGEKRKKDYLWTKGIYTGKVRLTREEKVIFEKEATIEVR